MAEKRLDLFLNHLHYTQADDHVIVDMVLERFIDEIVIFREQFDEALIDSSVGAHVLLPTTPVARQRRGKAGDKKVANPLSEKITRERPPPAETRGKKRAAASNKTESRRKRVSVLSDTLEASSQVSDVSLSSQAFDISSISSQLPHVEDTGVPLQQQRSLRPRRKNPNDLPNTDASVETASQELETAAPFTKQRSTRTKRRQRVSEGLHHLSESAAKQLLLIEGTDRNIEEDPPMIHDTEIGTNDLPLKRVSDKEGMVVLEDLEIKSPDLFSYSPPSNSISSISTPPVRPALPSSILLGSSVQSTPPARPSPPLIVSCQNGTIPGAPVAAQASSSPTVDALPRKVEQTNSDQISLVSTPQVFQQDSLDQTHRTTAANISCEGSSISQGVGALTHTSSRHSVNTSNHLSPTSVSETSPKPPSNQTFLSEVVASPQPPGNTVTDLSPPSASQTSPKHVLSDGLASPQLSGNTDIHDNTPSDKDLSPNPPHDPVTDMSLASDKQDSPQTPAKPDDTSPLPNTQGSLKSEYNQTSDFHTPTNILAEGVFAPGIETADSKQVHANTICETPATTHNIPAPTPSKTFSIQKNYDAGLSVTPPSELNKTRESSSRPVAQSPLLEQHPGPTAYRSHHGTGTPLTNPRPAQLPAGRTHTILKNAHVPTRTNSPSKFHSKCSPQSNFSIPMNTPNLLATSFSPNRQCKINLTKNFCSSNVFKSPNSSILSKLNSNTTRTNTTVTKSPFISPSNSITQVTNSSLQNIPRGLVSNLTGKFQANPQGIQSGKLATSISTFIKKKTVNPPLNTAEENKAKVEHKQLEDERRVGGLLAMKRKLLNKKKQENTKRQQEAAERRAELLRKQQEKVSQKLDQKEEKMKQWEKQSMRKKRAEEERSKREENDRRIAEEKRNLDKSRLKSSNPEVASTTFNSSSFMSSTQSHNDVTSYQIDDLDSENTDDEDNPRHIIPSWATEPYLSHRLKFQFSGSAIPDIIFPSSHLLQPMELTLVFEYNRYRRCKRPYHYRTSSAHWNSPMGKPS